MGTLLLFCTLLGPPNDPNILNISLRMIFGVLGVFVALVMTITLVEEQTLFKTLKNFFLGFILRRQNSVRGEGFGHWTTRSINSRLGNKVFSFNVGSGHTLVRLPFGKMALISKGAVIAIGYVERFEYGRSIHHESGALIMVYQAGPVLVEDGWAAREFRVLVCEADKLEDLHLETVEYRDQAPQLFSNDRSEIGILQYGKFPYKKQFPKIRRLLDLKAMSLVESK